MAATSVSGDGSELGAEEEEDDFARMVSDSCPSDCIDAIMNSGR